jgi:[calcium/calmodulin-dependent protein kinase] kinase
VDPAKSPTLHSILGLEHESHFVQPPLEMEPDESLDALKSYKRILRERDIGFRPYATSRERGRSPKRAGSAGISSPHGSGSCGATPALQPSRDDTPSTNRSISEGTRGHARSPLEEEHPYLFIGPSTFSGESAGDGDGSLPCQSGPHTPADGMLSPMDPNAVPIISESPGASEIDIYETAYREEIERIKKRSLARRDTGTTVYLTRRVESRRKHLSEVLKLIRQAEEESMSHSIPEPILQIGDKLSGALASAGSAVSALTSQLEARKQRGQAERESLTKMQDKESNPPSCQATAEQTASSEETNSSHPSSASKMLASTVDVLKEVGHRTAEKSQGGMKNLVDRLKSGEGSHKAGEETGTAGNAAE